jgi:hypothetical protein
VTHSIDRIDQRLSKAGRTITIMLQQMIGITLRRSRSDARQPAQCGNQRLKGWRRLHGRRYPLI